MIEPENNTTAFYTTISNTDQLYFDLELAIYFRRCLRPPPPSLPLPSSSSSPSPSFRRTQTCGNWVLCVSLFTFSTWFNVSIVSVSFFVVLAQHIRNEAFACDYTHRPPYSITNTLLPVCTFSIHATLFHNLFAIGVILIGFNRIMIKNWGVMALAFTKCFFAVLLVSYRNGSLSL